MAFTFVLTLSQGGSGGPASANDAAAYASAIGATESPVFADGNSAFASATPFNESSRPEACALTPEMQVISCASGHGAYNGLLDDIRSHAGM